MKYIVLIDFGSTFTKAAVVNTEIEKVIFSTKYPSTVHTDAGIALNQCLDEVREIIGDKAIEEAEIHASSSAAGGLRIAVVGLTDNLSISAGKNVAFGAGAKIVHVASGSLTETNVETLESVPAEMILFCGGYENGNRTTLVHNAQMLAKSKVQCPIIYGGNSAVSQEIRSIMIQGNKECFLIPNIIPQVGRLETRAGEEIIRNLFMKRIVNMKGLAKVQEVVGDIIPTPAAVLEAGKLFSLGYEGQKGHGNLMIVDVGGATTDIHSYAEQVPGDGARIVGAQEPYAKRTVEGDLGMRESSDTLVQDAGISAMAEAIGISEEQLQESVQRRVKDIDFLPDSELELQIDQNIAAYAAGAAARRHAGKWQLIHSSNCNRMQVGKNLTEIRYVLGTGGQIVNSRDPIAILNEVLRKEGKDSNVLLPKESKFYVDYDYILYAVGLLSGQDKKLAFAVMENGILGKGYDGGYYNGN